MANKSFEMENPFAYLKESVRGMEFSKKLGNALKSANRLRKDAAMEFYNRRMPLSVAKELAGEFNKSIRAYNRNRQKLVEAANRGFFDGSEKTFSIEQNLMNAAATFQRVWTLLLRYPRNVNRANTENQSHQRDTADTPHIQISNLRKIGYGLGAAAIFLACGTVDAITQTAVPSETGNENDNSAQGLVDSTQDGSEIDPNSLATEQPATNGNEAIVSASLQQDPDYDNAYVQYVDEQNGQPLTKEGTDFLDAIGVNGKGIVDDQYVSIGVNSYGILYAEHADKEIFVFNIKDKDGNYLIGTKQEAFDRLSAENPSAVAGKTIDDFTLTTDVVNGVLLSLVDNESGKPMEGINAQTRQWSAIDNNGALVSSPTAVATETIGAETSDAGLLEVNQEAISAMVKDFASGAIEFPSDMTKEQYSDFIDGMNDLVGRKPIYVETTNSAGAKIVLYFDIATNRMAELPGSYAENKAIIDQNVLEVFVKISEEPGTGNIQFVNSKGELVTSPNSAGVDWDLRVDDSNYKNGLIDLPTIIGEETPGSFWDKIIGGITLNNPTAKRTFVPGILMDNTASRIVSNQNGWNPYPTLNVMFIRKDQKTGKAAYGVRTMVGAPSNIYLGEEGGTIDVTGLSSRVELRDSDDIKRFEAGAVYYIGVPENQKAIWDENNKADIDELQGADSEAGSFDNAINQDVPNDGNIILTGSPIIKKK